MTHEIDSVSPSFLKVEKILGHLLFRQACKRFVHGEDGFYCDSYPSSHHTKYVFLIKWQNCSENLNTWEEEWNLTSSQDSTDKLADYKFKNGLPPSMEVDNFNVENFLEVAVRRGDPEVSPKVSIFVKNNWIQP